MAPYVLTLINIENSPHIKDVDMYEIHHMFCFEMSNYQNIKDSNACYRGAI